MIKPVFEKLSNTYKHVVFVKVDVDQNQEVAAVAGVSAMYVSISILDIDRVYNNYDQVFFFSLLCSDQPNTPIFDI